MGGIPGQGAAAKDEGHKAVAEGPLAAAVLARGRPLVARSGHRGARQGAQDLPPLQNRCVSPRLLSYLVTLTFCYSRVVCCLEGRALPISPWRWSSNQQALPHKGSYMICMTWNVKSCLCTCRRGGD